MPAAAAAASATSPDRESVDASATSMPMMAATSGVDAPSRMATASARPPDAILSERWVLTWAASVAAVRLIVSTIHVARWLRLMNGP